jgi:hypothetical protein
MSAIKAGAYYFHCPWLQCVPALYFEHHSRTTGVNEALEVVAPQRGILVPKTFKMSGLVLWAKAGW